MISIESKIKKTIVFSLLITTLVFIIITISLMFLQTRIILSENDKISSEFENSTYNALLNAMTGYANDLGQSCLNSIANNYDDYEDLGCSIANFTQMLYTDGYSAHLSDFYGVGFAEGKTAKAVAEINDISDVREYISTYCGYNADNLDALDIFIVTENGLVIDGTKANYGDSYEDQRKEQWYIDCKNTKAPLWTGVIKGSVTGKKKIDYVYPIIVNNEFKGISVISMEINSLYNSLLKNDFKNIKEIALLDSSGEEIIGGSDYAKASKKFDLTDTGAMNVDGNNFWISFKLPNKDFIICFEFALNELYDTVANYNESFDKSNDAIKSYTGGLFFVMAIIYVIIALLLILILVIISGKMGRSIVNPLLLLSKKAENFGRENMDIDISDINTNDEVGLLADSFYKMSENIKKYMSEIAEITAEKERVNAEMETAAKIQLSLMGSDFPTDSRCSIYGRMVPAKFVGGDVYAAFDIDDDNVLVFVGDVAGKGLPASFISIRTKINIQIYGEANLGPALTLKYINNRLCENNEESIFVTAFLGVFNKKTGVLRYANAGHNKPIVADSDPHFLNTAVGVPLGCFEDIEYTDESITLKKGESIFIYSDGVPEAVGADNSFYTNERFLKLVAETTSTDYTAQSLVSAVANDLKLHYKGKELWDDITMLVLKYTGEDQ